MYIISIDIGLNNLGIVGAQNSKFHRLEINLCKKIDIKALCQYCNIKNCGLYHNLCISDYVSHFLKKYQKYFNMADIILIERQPPNGFISIQEIIVFQYREKIKMISPNSVHKYFDITHYDYSRRKDFVTQYAQKALKDFPDFKNSKRKHDISDAYCMIIFYLHNAKRQTPLELLSSSLHQEKINLKQFKYIHLNLNFTPNNNNNNNNYNNDELSRKKKEEDSSDKRTRSRFFK